MKVTYILPIKTDKDTFIYTNTNGELEHLPRIGETVKILGLKSHLIRKVVDVTHIDHSNTEIVLYTSVFDMLTGEFLRVDIKTPR